MYGGGGYGFNNQGGVSYDQTQQDPNMMGYNPYAQQQQQQGQQYMPAQPMYDANGFPIQQYDPNMMPPQQFDNGADGGYLDQAQDASYVGYDEDQRNLSTKKSFSGPRPGDGAGRSRSSAGSRSARSRSSKRGSIAGGGNGGLARNGSVFRPDADRNTQRSVSTRGHMSTRGVGGGDDDDDLTKYYGDMAKRTEEQRFDGFKAVKSYRGDIDDAMDVGKPRRVVGARNLQGKSSTGYGGLGFKRKVAMSNGEGWGDIEVRRTGGGGRDDDGPPANKGRSLNMDVNSQQDQNQQPPFDMDAYMRHQHELAMMQMMAMQDQPAVPQIFQQEDVQAYSNLSDAFSEVLDEEDGQFYE